MIDIVQKLQTHVAQERAAIIRFMREICAIPSRDSQIGPVGARIGAEMRKLGYDEVRFDRMGKTVQCIGRQQQTIEQQRVGRDGFVTQSSALYRQQKKHAL